MNKSTSHTFGYVRISTKDKQTVASQMEAMDKWQTENRQFDRVYSDEGVSGTVLAADRPQFSRLLEIARSGDTIVVYDLDRVGRDAIDVQTTVKFLNDKDINLVIIRYDIDTKSDMGKMMVAILANLAEMERNKILERTRLGREAAKAQGTHMGRKQETSLEEVARLRLIEGKSINETTAILGCARSTVTRITAQLKEMIKEGDERAKAQTQEEQLEIVMEETPQQLPKATPSKKAGGRKKQLDGMAVWKWKVHNKATLDETAAHFKVNVSTIKRRIKEAKAAMNL